MDIINSEKSYKNYIRELLLSGVIKEEIISFDSYEKSVCANYFSCDIEFDDFLQITNQVLDELTKIVFQDDLKKERIEHLKNQWKDYQKIDLLILKFNEVAISNFQSKQTMYIKNIDLITQFVGFLNTAGYSTYYNPLENGGYILNINL